MVGEAARVRGLVDQIVAGVQQAAAPPPQQRPFAGDMDSDGDDGMGGEDLSGSDKGGFTASRLANATRVPHFDKPRGAGVPLLELH